MATDDLAGQLLALQREVARLSAARAVENLINLYTYKLMANEFDGVADLFALTQPDVSVELAHTGVYYGPEKVRQMYTTIHAELLTPTVGCLFADMNCQPVIEVSGDGKTAKGLWSTWGVQTIPDEEGKPHAYWCYQKRAMDFILEGGAWKIWHYHAFVVFACPYEKSWVDTTEDDLPMVFKMALPGELAANKPSTYHKPYSKDYMVEYVPRAPEPYETWSNTFSY